MTQRHNKIEHYNIAFRNDFKQESKYLVDNNSREPFIVLIITLLGHIRSMPMRVVKCDLYGK